MPPTTTHRRSPREFRPTLAERSAGILLHPTSLPGPDGCGDLGAAAHEFADFLHAAGVRWWQMLPIGPPARSGSPYSAFSAFAGSPLLISVDALRADGLLTSDERVVARRDGAGRVRYHEVAAARDRLLRLAFSRFGASRVVRRTDFDAFVERERGWLDDYALFAALRRANRGRAWFTWPPPIRRRVRAALRTARAALQDTIAFEQFVQYVFDRQWKALQRHCRSRDVALLGDIPIFVGHDSADVWAHQDLFTLDRDGRTTLQSGVPPDDFSATGQLWSHPLYRWAAHRRDDFAWWVARFAKLTEQFDGARIDHFLGFVRCWAAPGRARVATHGKWLPTPGAELIAAVRSRLGAIEIIAEDLGLLTRAAAALRDALGFPGMRVLQFAFGAGSRYHQPHSYPHHCAVYTGTHDNDTLVGWFESLKTRNARRRGAGRRVESWNDQLEHERVLRYAESDGSEIHWDLIRLALASPANTAIIPAQDLLGLDSTARMNRPATVRGNWSWRLAPGALTPAIAARLRKLNETFDRVRDR
ncbi:MAG: 4-alpha-glucanotransferase [Phycisphaerae bacterium]